MISDECIKMKDQELGTASHDTLYGELAIKSQEIQIRNIIKMSKRLNAFKSLCEQDKVILIKYASFEIITLRMVLNFNFQDMYWTANINTGKQDITCKLTAIILFNPNRPNLVNKNTIKLQQYVYFHLLKRYLQMKYRSELLSNGKLLRLIKNL
ncbi:unnamed protein product, partial [Oppiella nova]